MDHGGDARPRYGDFSRPAADAVARFSPSGHAILAGRPGIVTLSSVLSVTVIIVVMGRLKLLAKVPLSGWRRHRLALAVTVVGVVAAGIAASVAAGGSSRATPRHAARAHRAPARTAANGRHGWRGDVPVAAEYLGVAGTQVRRQLRSGKSLGAIAAATPGKSQSALIEAIVAARVSRLSAAAAAGRLSSTAEQKRLAQLRGRVTREVARSGGPAVLGAGALTPAARYLGLSVPQLRKQLPGQSLAQVANATPGRSAAGLVATLVAEGRARLQAAVNSGRLSSKAEARWLASLTDRVTARVNHVHHTRAHRARRHA